MASGRARRTARGRARRTARGRARRTHIWFVAADFHKRKGGRSLREVWGGAEGEENKGRSKRESSLMGGFDKIIHF